MSAHILNGDSLLQQLHSDIQGDVFVARECLIDGNVQGSSLSEFYANRAQFISNYEGCSADDYYLKAVPEFEKIMRIDSGTSIYCWFEDDLFCQTNFWFVMHLLIKQQHQGDIYLVRPNAGNEYSFADMSQAELQQSLKDAVHIDRQSAEEIAKLWPLYQAGSHQQMLAIAKRLATPFPFLTPAVIADSKRQPDATGLGYPERKLLSIMKTLNSEDFGLIFREFSKSEGVYSFGDLQVKAMFDKLITSMK